MKTLKRLMGVALAIGLVGAVVGTSFADDTGFHSNPTPRPGVSLGGRAAYYWPNATEADNGNWFGGGQLRGYLNKWFGIEASADYQHRTFLNNRFDADVYPVQLNGLVYLTPDYRVSPFILGGVGWYVTHTHGPAGFDNTEDRFAQQVGGGLQWFMSRHWSVDATYRYIFTSGFDATRSTGENVHISGDGHQVTGGINYHF